MKTITSQKLMKILSIVFIILSGYNLIIDFITRLYIVSFRGFAQVVNDIIFLVFGIYGIRNYDIPGKERKLIRMSIIAFVSSVVSTLIYYLPLLTRLDIEVLQQMIDFGDILYIMLAVLAIIYFFAARRILLNKNY